MICCDPYDMRAQPDTAHTGHHPVWQRQRLIAVCTTSVVYWVALMPTTVPTVYYVAEGLWFQSHHVRFSVNVQREKRALWEYYCNQNIDENGRA